MRVPALEGSLSALRRANCGRHTFNVALEQIGEQSLGCTYVGNPLPARVEHIDEMA